MLRGIVGVRLRLDRLEGKHKLSQNRPPEDRAGATAAGERWFCTEAEAREAGWRAAGG